ncbi:hypothetical protein JR316_0002382 [Psilocybe cubensis]|uniref:Uncharacterized protein n=2 Tax=Psilocybe cubensis TaxID=181762 RepID=A0ACB8HCR2_PSICU|nr:hypothetical protein JR316_0002382 [Psilocybe cubensis]KAH9485474.1 hypothetical protein JR316_0002382 [Psilocybe cubensis]
MPANQSPMSDTTEVQSGISATIFELQEAFTALSSCTTEFANFHPKSDSTQREIEACSRRILEHDREMKGLLDKTKSELVDDIKRAAEASVRAKIVNLVRQEVMRQVKEQVDEQIKEHLPESLQQQADEGKRQVEEMKISLRNS